MPEDKKSLIDLVPDSVDNAIKNITDKPTQNIGTTFADIWYLVFGGISQVAEERKLKYSYALKQFEKELQEKISKIPEEKQTEPDIQIIAPALESAKFCMEKEALRKLFVELISNSINIDYCTDIHPIYTEIIKQMSTIDAAVLNNIFKYQDHSTLTIDVDDETLLLSLSVLEKHGLIRTDMSQKLNTNKRIYIFDDTLENTPTATEISKLRNTIHIELTPLGKKFCSVCIS